ncbi:glycosyltransferase [Chromobacterium haemolyticum]|uniref:glycosyltransferase n=1 Tax=Chromobacterium haemolyticum TaxID=394935 RepID=UPI004055ED5F
MGSRKVRVIFFVARLDKTSVMVLTTTLISLLLDKNYDVFIVEWRSALSTRTLPKIMMEPDDYDKTVFISVGALADAFATGVRLWKHRKNWRFISWLHCHPWEDLRWERPWVIAVPYYLLWILGLVNKDRVVCVSRDVAANLPIGLGRKAFSVHNPVPAAPQAQGPKVLEEDLHTRVALEWIENQKGLGRKVILTFGLMRKRKNFEQAIRALSLDDSLSLIIFGDGPERESLIHVAENSETIERLALMPFVETPFRFCRHADIYISNTHSEGFGLANVEAALTGIPTVLPNLNVNVEVLGCFPNVFFFQHDSDSDFLSAIKCALKTPHLLEGLENPYTLERFENEWHNIIKEA